MEIEEFKQIQRDSLSSGMRIYWREMLYRAHWASTASLIRSHRWLSGLTEAHAQGNLMTFAASCRGLLESAADTNDALNLMPTALAEFSATIAQAVAGRLERPVVSPRLEDLLLHFTHARKSKGDELDAVLRAKTVAQYLSDLKEADPEIGEVYAALCEIVHAGATSVLAYSIATEDRDVVVSQSLEPAILERYRGAFVRVAPTALAYGTLPAMFTLKVLNLFDLAEVRTPGVDGLLEDLQVWGRIQKLVAESSETA